MKRRLHPLLLPAFVIVAMMEAAAIAAPTKVALIATRQDAQQIADCVKKRLATEAPVVSHDALVEGLEFRFRMQRQERAPAILIVTGLLKPDAAALVAPPDDDPEAQPQAVSRMVAALRIHIGTRAWPWLPAQHSRLCSAAAQWIDALRKRPILLDRIAADGEAFIPSGTQSSIKP